MTIERGMPKLRAAARRARRRRGRALSGLVGTSMLFGACAGDLGALESTSVHDDAGGLATSEAALTSAPDTDGDGLADTLEQALGTDPAYWDSNVNGLSDFYEARRAGLIDASGQLSAAAGVAGPLAAAPAADPVNDDDNDQDGISNTAESYGFYYVMGRFVEVDHFLTLAEYQEFCTQPYLGPLTLQQTPYEVACAALNSAGGLVFVQRTLRGEEGYSVRTASLTPILKASFLKAYGNDVLAEGLTNDVGSVANIMRTLLEMKPVDIDTQGKRLSYFYTNPESQFSDFDPLSDREEIQGGPNTASIIAPANHPYVSAYPQLSIKVSRYDVILQGQITTAKGESRSTGWTTNVSETVENAYSMSESNTLSTSATAEVNYSPVGFGGSASVTVEASRTTTSETSYGASRTQEKGTQEALALDWSTAVSTDMACAAKVTPSIEVRNGGTAPLTLKGLLYTLYIGTTALETKEFGGAVYVGAGKQEGPPNIALEPVCITMNQLRYLNTGGNLSIETILSGATMSVWTGSGYENSDAMWPGYLDNIEKQTALVELSFPREDGRGLEELRSYRVLAKQNGGFGMSMPRDLTLRDALEATLKREDVGIDKQAGKVLYRDDFGDLQAMKISKITERGLSWTQALHVGILPVANGQVLRDSKGEVDEAKIKAELELIADDILTLPLRPGYQYHLTIPSSPVPEVKSIVVQRTTPSQARVLAVVRDDVGLTKVELCGLSNGCRTLRADAADLFAIDVPVLEVTASPFLRVTNGRRDKDGNWYTTTVDAGPHILTELRDDWAFWQAHRPMLPQDSHQRAEKNLEEIKTVQAWSAYDGTRYADALAQQQYLLEVYGRGVEQAAKCEPDGSGADFGKCVRGLRLANGFPANLNESTEAYLASLPRAVVYTGHRYAGNVAWLTPGIHAVFNGTFDNNLRSIRVAPGYHAAGFQHFHLWGLRFEYAGDMEDVSRWGTVISSMAIVKGDRVIARDEATLYEHDPYYGRELKLGLGRMNFHDTFNDIASSARIPGGLSLFLYYDKDWTGGVQELEGDLWRLPNHDSASSAMLYRSLTHVALHSHHGKYLVAENDGGGDVNANRAVRGAWEHFNIVQGSTEYHCIKSGSQVAISTGVGRFLSIGSNGWVNAGPTAISAYETFVLENHSDKIGCLQKGGNHVISLYNPRMRRYLSATPGGDAVIQNHSERGPWEGFTVY